MFVWISPARLRAKHWNIPVSSGRRPLICRLPPTNTLYLGIFTGLMGTASLYHTMSGCGVPAEGGQNLFYFCWLVIVTPLFLSFFHAPSNMHRHTSKQTVITNLVPDRGYPPPSPSLHWCDSVALWQTEETLFQRQNNNNDNASYCCIKAFRNNSQIVCAFYLHPSLINEHLHHSR